MPMAHITIYWHLINDTDRRTVQSP